LKSGPTAQLVKGINAARALVPAKSHLTATPDIGNFKTIELKSTTPRGIIYDFAEHGCARLATVHMIHFQTPTRMLATENAGTHS
jgi:hypothetical protein